MGVPKFYRWISERYPCLSEVIRGHQIPEFDNLYLDMNGIIHICSHPNDDDPHFRITEEKIFSDIFRYIDYLFRMIKPRKVFFMAVDGVAPRAKMNQQRGRRFRSAKEAEENEKKAKQRGEKLPTEARFDSNCITPGTHFMTRLHAQLQYFVNMKISTDLLWQGPRIYLSGHETPGEGEHKIMEFIRCEKQSLDYDRKTRHCLYGLDADLIMLGLCSHEPYFVLLREEVKFGGKNSKNNGGRIPTAESTTFHLLHLTLLREYVDMEFSSLKSTLKETLKYNLDCVIDDWILMGFLVGNDFIPNLPSLHIAKNALPVLYEAYIYIMPHLDGYLNEAGRLNLKNFEMFIEQLAKYEFDQFVDNYTDLKWLEGKKSAKKLKGGVEINKSQRKVEGRNQVLAAPVDKNGQNGNMFAAFESEEDTDSDDDGSTSSEIVIEPILDEEDLIELEFTQHKRQYYQSKLEYEVVTEDVLKEQAEGYIRAIQWNLHYYYDGVQSWGWFYPHHYSPFISDLKNFVETVDVSFDLGKPFLPFEQLLAVLPSLSSNLLPEAYRYLMCDQTSPIIDFYPADFKTDLNDKQQDWEAVVLIPFIDERRLLEAMAPINQKITAEEKSRNTHGPCLLYKFNRIPQGDFKSLLPQAFSDIIPTFAQLEKLDPYKGFFVELSDNERVKQVWREKRISAEFVYEFPTFRHLEFTYELKKASVKVFQMTSRNDSMFITLNHDSLLEREQAAIKKAQGLLGRVVLVDWPHLRQALIVSVMDSNSSVKLAGDVNSVSNPLALQKEEGDGAFFTNLASATSEQLRTRWGVWAGPIYALVQAKFLIGHRYKPQPMSMDAERIKVWSNCDYVFPSHMVLEISDETMKKADMDVFRPVQSLYEPGLMCFLLEEDHYGQQGRIHTFDQYQCRVRVELVTSSDQEPNIGDMISDYERSQGSYMTAHIGGQKLGISPHFLSRITGTLFITRNENSPQRSGRSNHGGNRTNLGLNLKFTKRNQEMPGYTKRDLDGTTWLYSEAAFNLVEEYIEKFPDIVDYLSLNRPEHCMNEDSLRSHIRNNSQSGKQDDHKNILDSVSQWLGNLPTTKCELRNCGVMALDEASILKIEQAITQSSTKEAKSVPQIFVKPNVLFVPAHHYLESSDTVPVDPENPNSSFNLYDRVVCARLGFTVPVGYRGTVIGIHQSKDKEDNNTNTSVDLEKSELNTVDILFDHEFTGATKPYATMKRASVLRLPSYALINLTVKKRVVNGGKVKKERTKTEPKLYSNVVVGPREPVRVDGSLPSRTASSMFNHSPNSPFVPRKKDEPDFNGRVTLLRREPSQGSAETTRQQQEFWQALKGGSASSSSIHVISRHRMLDLDPKEPVVFTRRSMDSVSNKSLTEAAKKLPAPLLPQPQPSICSQSLNNNPLEMFMENLQIKSQPQKLQFEPITFTVREQKDLISARHTLNVAQEYFAKGKPPRYYFFRRIDNRVELYTCTVVLFDGSEHTSMECETENRSWEEAAIAALGYVDGKYGRVWETAAPQSSLDGNSFILKLAAERRPLIEPQFCFGRPIDQSYEPGYNNWHRNQPAQSELVAEKKPSTIFVPLQALQPMNRARGFSASNATVEVKAASNVCSAEPVKLSQPAQAGAEQVSRIPNLMDIVTRAEPSSSIEKLSPSGTGVRKPRLAISFNNL